MAEKQKLFVNNRWTASSAWEPVFNPYSGRPIAEVAVAGSRLVERAAASTEAAASAMAAMTAHERASLLSGIVHGIARNAKILAEILCRDAGKPIALARGEVNRAKITFTLGAEEARRLAGEAIPLDADPGARGYWGMVRRFPIGPVLAISPFNFPLNLVAHKLAPALAAGNPVLLKLPPQAPLCGLELARIVKEAGAPPGAFNVIHCAVPEAEALVRDERFALLSFTGSCAVGWHLKRIAGRKKVLLELGGNAAAAVMPDADLAHAAGRLALGAFVFSGQVCISVQRVMVHRKVYDAFKKRFVAEVKKLIVGDPRSKEVVAGPLIDAASADRVMQWIAQAKSRGARVLTGNRRQKNILAPTVLENVPRDCRIYTEEVFGPVACLESFENFDQAVERINDSQYGLQAGIFTRDLGLVNRAFTEIKVGGLIVNDYPTFRTDNAPYGGIKASGLGREGVRYAVQEMTEPRLLVVNSNV